MFKFVKMFEGVKRPEKKNGYSELFCSGDVTIPPYEKAYLPTGIRVEFSPRYFVHINGSTPSRRILAGVVDSDYRGEMKVLIFNRSSEEVEIKKHEKCANMHCIELTQVDLVEAS